MNSCLLQCFFMLLLLWYRGCPLGAAQDPERLEMTFSGQYNTDDPELGHRNIPLVDVRHTLKYDRQTIFDVNYKTDEYGRRITPGDYKGRKKFALFLGCSFTWGIGVEANQTLPYYFAQMNKEYVPYNYGIGATGPHQFLRLLETRQIRTEIQEPVGLGIFYYLEEHIQRVVGAYPAITYLFDSPYYDFNENNELEYRGSFSRARPWRTKLYRSLDLFRGNILKNRIFPRLSSLDGQLACEVIQKIQKKFLQQFPNSKFLVLMNSADLEFSMKECLNSKGVQSVALVPYLHERLAHKGIIPHDGHPTAQAHEVSAEILTRALKQSEPVH